MLLLAVRHSSHLEEMERGHGGDVTAQRRVLSRTHARATIECERVARAQTDATSYLVTVLPEIDGDEEDVRV